ncbi:MAG TPA: KEOPS complex kinase/ATPase Bud32 [Candidatus Nanoarchaeia archaeon]|nr:KEOPS complex kinase/ATPase Bud32 [Candidatus Nanoarchaeia archaeon]
MRLPHKKIQKPTYQGAEAVLYDKNNLILKHRVKKNYRINEIDNKLRKSRTRREAKILETLRKINFPSPRLIDFNDKTMQINMEKIEGEKVRDILEKNNCGEICRKIGELVAELHHNNIIHSDLTTSNMIYSKNYSKNNTGNSYGKIYFIDFGLSFFSHKIEDKAVDIHLLKQAMESKHYKIWKKCFDAVLKGYNKKHEHKEIMHRLEIVERRGRYKQ